MISLHWHFEEKKKNDIGTKWTLCALITGYGYITCQSQYYYCMTAKYNCIVKVYFMSIQLKRMYTKWPLELAPIPFKKKHRLLFHHCACHADLQSWTEKLVGGQTLDFRQFYPFSCHGKALQGQPLRWDRGKGKTETKPVRERRQGNTPENVERITGEGGIVEIKRTINCQRTVWTAHDRHYTHMPAIQADNSLLQERDWDNRDGKHREEVQRL